MPGIRYKWYYEVEYEDLGERHKMRGVWYCQSKSRVEQVFRNACTFPGFKMVSIKISITGWDE